MSKYLSIATLLLTLQSLVVGVQARIYQESREDFQRQSNVDKAPGDGVRRVLGGKGKGGSQMMGKGKSNSKGKGSDRTLFVMELLLKCETSTRIHQLTLSNIQLSRDRLHSLFRRRLLL